MAKRFTDTDKWKKPFVRGLQGAYKLLWFYICDDCDHAGIWQVDLDVAEIRTGEKLNLLEAIKNYGEKIIPIDNGSKWFIPSFIEFQYPSGLNPDNKAHGGIIKLLQKYNLIDKNFKPLISPLQGDKDKDKDMDKVMDMDKDKEEGEKIEFTNPFSENFLNAWVQWKYYKLAEFKFKYKSIQSEQAAVNELVTLSKGKEDLAIEIIKQSLAKGWKGFFELKTSNNGTSKNTTTVGKVTGAGLDEALAKRYSKSGSNTSFG
jgi:hypothetical protein